MEPRPNPGFRWWMVPLVGVVLAVMGTAAGVSVWWGRRVNAYGEAARTLPAEIAAAQREGPSLNPWDLREHPPAPASQNAAPLYRRLLRAEPPGGEADDRILSDFVKPGHGGVGPAKARAALARNARFLALAERASGMPQCDFQRQYELGPNLLLPEYAPMRRAARMLAARATLKGESGDAIGSLADVGTGARIGRHAGSDPVLIAALVQVAIDAIMDRAFREAVLSHSGDPRVLRAAIEAERAFGRPPDMGRALSSELVMDRVIVAMVARDPKAIRDFGLAGASLPVLLGSQSARSRMLMADAWEARMVRYWRRVLGALRRSERDPVGTYQAVAALGQREEQNEGKPTYELSAILMPVFSQAVLKAMACEERARLRAALLGLVTYRQRTGRWSDSLAALPHAPPADIFTGRPPIYRRTPGGFVLYSVGENFRDDGGKAEGDRMGEPPPDIVVQYPVR